MAAALGVSLAGSLAGGVAANALTGSENTGNGNLSQTVNLPSVLSQMNQILNASLGNAVNTSTNYTNQAINEQNSSLGTATNALTGANTAANSALSSNVNQGTAQNQALQGPYNSAGYQALDTYMGDLGLATPVGGSQALATNRQNAALVGAALQPLNGNYNAPTPPTPGTAPTLQSFLSQVTPQQINQYIQQNATAQNVNSKGAYFGNNIYTGVGANQVGGTDQTQGDSGYGQVAAPISGLEANQGLTSQVAQYLAQQPYQQALTQYQQQKTAANQQYQTQNQAYQNVGNVIAQTGITPQQLAQAAAYNSGNISGVK